MRKQSKNFYSTEEKARQGLRDTVGTPVGFCPITNGGCDPNCVCYQDAVLVKPLVHPDHPDHRYILLFPHCTNAMLTGARYDPFSKSLD